MSLLSLWSLFTYSQNVVYDQIAPNGSHVIMTKPKNFIIENQDYDFSLRYYESEHDMNWRVTLATDKKIPQDNIVLLKLKNGQTIKLVVDSLLENTYTVGGNVIYHSPSISTVQPSITRTAYFSESNIKIEELDSIEAYGISKIRLGNNVKYYEEEWTNNPLGKFLTKCRKKIAERLQNSKEPKNKKSIYDGF